ncbi:MAG: sterol desaturase family protein [Brasilonema sp.]
MIGEEVGFFFGRLSKISNSITDVLNGEFTKIEGLNLIRIFKFVVGIYAIYFSSQYFFGIKPQSLSHLPIAFQTSLLTLQTVFFPFEDDFRGLWIVGILALLLLLLEYFLPADDFVGTKSTGSDLIYFYIENLGLSGFALYISVSPFMDGVETTLRSWGVPFLDLGGTLNLWNVPIVLAAIIHLFIFDGFDTIRHRFEHFFSGLWAFHSVHHSQTRMNFLTFDRNHVVSLVYNSIWYAAVARFFGVKLDVLFIVFVVFHFIEYFAHANVKLSYGKFFDKVLVSPLYHRLHHASAKKYNKPPYGCNFANVFPFWDIVMGTANFNYEHVRTGISGEGVKEIGRNYFAHQISGFIKFSFVLKNIYKNK